MTAFKSACMCIDMFGCVVLFYFVVPLCACVHLCKVEKQRMLPVVE